MPENTQKVKQVSSLLSQLARKCDSGFAIAVHIRYTRPSLLYQTYAQDWNDHYSEQGYMLTDPVVHWGLTQTGWVAWDDLLDKDTAGVLADAKKFGLNHGWTYAVGDAHSRTISGHTRSDTTFSDQDRAEIIAIIDEIHTLTEGFDQLPLSEQDALRHLL